MSTIKEKVFSDTIKLMIQNHIENIAKEEDESIFNDVFTLIQRTRSNPNREDSYLLWDIFCDNYPLMRETDEQSILALIEEELGVIPNEYLVEVVKEKRNPQFIYTSKGIKIGRSYNNSPRLITII